MTTFIADTVLQTALEAILKVAQGTLLVNTPYWGDIITASNQSAFNSITTNLQAQGFSTQQIQAWDRGIEYNTDIGLYWCLVKGAALHSYDDKFISRFDRRKELNPAVVTNGGQFVYPVGPPQMISIIPQDGSRDQFGVPEDPNDPRQGKPVRF
jgi:hypothetical protein